MNWKCPFLCSKETRRTCRKTLGARRRINNKLSPHVMPGLGNHTQATVVRGKHSHHCTIPIPLCHLYFPAPFLLPCANSSPFKFWVLAKCLIFFYFSPPIIEIKEWNYHTHCCRCLIFSLDDVITIDIMGSIHSRHIQSLKVYKVNQPTSSLIQDFINNIWKLLFFGIRRHAYVYRNYTVHY